MELIVEFSSGVFSSSAVLRLLLRLLRPLSSLIGYLKKHCNSSVLDFAFLKTSFEVSFLKVKKEGKQSRVSKRLLFGQAK